MRYTGAYQIEQSKQDAQLLTATLPHTPQILPGEIVRLVRSDFGVKGDFYVQESRAVVDASGVRGILTMRRKQ